MNEKTYIEFVRNKRLKLNEELGLDYKKIKEMWSKSVNDKKIHLNVYDHMIYFALTGKNYKKMFAKETIKKNKDKDLFNYLSFHNSYQLLQSFQKVYNLDQMVFVENNSLIKDYIKNYYKSFSKN